MLDTVRARSSAFPLLISFAHVQTTAVTYPPATKKNPIMMAVLLFGQTVRMEDPMTVVPSSAPMIHPNRLPVKSEP